MKRNEIFKNESTAIPTKKDDVSRFCLVRDFDDTLVTFSRGESKLSEKVIRFSGDTLTLAKSTFTADCVKVEDVVPDFLEDDTE